MPNKAHCQKGTLQLRTTVADVGGAGRIFRDTQLLKMLPCCCCRTWCLQAEGFAGQTMWLRSCLKNKRSLMGASWRMTSRVGRLATDSSAF